MTNRSSVGFEIDSFKNEHFWIEWPEQQRVFKKRPAGR